MRKRSTQTSLDKIVVAPVSTLFARGVLYIVGLAALAVCFILIPELVREESVGKPINPFVTLTFFGVVYSISIPFFIALYQTHKLLGYIDNNKAFSLQSIQTLKNIKLCAIIFAVMVVVAVIGGISFAKIVDPSEDVTFMVPIGFIFTFVPAVLAVFVAVLQKLLMEAVAMKSENDLIV